MTDNVPPQNIDAEEAVIGAALVTGAALEDALVEARVAPEHFYLERHGAIWRVITALHDQGKPVDELTVLAELEDRGLVEKVGGKHRVAELAAKVPAAGNARHYGEIVVQCAQWRLKLQAGQLIQMAVHERDPDKLIEAEEMLARDLVHSSADFSPEDLADIAYEMLESEGVEAFPWPFKTLNDKTAGGMRRGEFIGIGGHSSHGKSQFLDQTLETLHKRELRVRLYMNEMSLKQRVARLMGRHTGLPYSEIINAELTPEQIQKAMKYVSRGFPFGITMVAGWSAEEIAHHIRRNRWDVAAVDILHRIDYEDERDVGRISGTFARTALQADCVLLTTVHLNENRVQTTVRPRPTLGDIRASGAIKNDADAILFVYRDQDPETGEPLEESAIYFSKVRNGEVGGMKARFNPRHLRFEGWAGG